jgi:hypothetical protein
VDDLRIARQNKFSAVDYHNLMHDGLDDVSDERIKALEEIERDKPRVARAYNKRVKKNHFRLGVLFGRHFCLSDPKVTYWKVVAKLGRIV